MSKPCVGQDYVKIYACQAKHLVMIEGDKETWLKRRKLWFDTMASHSITSDLSLFGESGPNQHCDIDVLDWSSNSMNVQRCGMTVFGPMLYHPEAAGTILAAYEMQQVCEVTWGSKKKVENVCTSDVNKNIVIHFKQDPVDRVLEGVVSIEMYNTICENAPSRPGMIPNFDAMVAQIQLESGGFRRSLEAVHGHKLMCHTCNSYLAKTATLGIMTNLPFGARDVNNIDLISNGKCPCCAVAKSREVSRDPNKRFDPTRPLDHTLPDEDKCFPAYPESKSETLGFDHMFIDGRPTLVCVGRNLGYVHAVSVTSRTAKVVQKAIELIIKDYNRYGLDVTELTNARMKAVESATTTHFMAVEMDNEGAFINAALELFGKKYKINAAFVVAGEHISYVERAIRTLKERVSAMRVSLPYIVEGKVLNWLIAHAAMWMNTLFSKRAPQSAWYNLTGTRLNYRDLSRTVFGEVVVAHRPGLVLKHNQPKGEMGISLGANPRQAGAIFFYSFETKRIKSRLRFQTNIAIDATVYFKKNKNVVTGEVISRSYMKYVEQRNKDELLNYFEDNPKIKVASEVPSKGENDKDPLGSCFMHEGTVDDPSEATVVEEMPHATVDDDDATIMAMRISHATIMAARNGLTNTNISWKKALDRPGEDGRLAELRIIKELRQIILEYDVCVPIPKGEHVENYFRSHALYDSLKDKARVVIGRRIRDIFIDFGVDINSPTINGKLVNIMLSKCIEEQLEFEVWDVKGAFLKSPLNTDGVYVKIESIVVDKMLDILRDEDPVKYRKWKEDRRSDGTIMMRVQRGWYGLSAASALWYKEISTTLVEKAGYKIHPMDRCLFYKKDGDGYAYIMLHVDDMGVMIRRGSPERNRLLKIMEDKYEKLKIQTEDKVKYIGLELFRNRKENRFEVTMKDYINKMCDLHDVGKRGMKRPVTNPCESLDFGKTVYDNAEDNMDISDKTAYRSLVMSMQYGTLVMPSVKFHVISLATRQAHPKVGDYKKAIRVLKFMRDKADKSLNIYGHGRNPDIYIYTDAAFDVYSDSISHSGMSVFLGNAGGVMHSTSNKQKCVTRSSTEAEIVAAVEALAIGQYYQGILKEFGTESRIIHYEDNMSCISLTSTGCHSYDKKDRHIVRKINLMYEYYQDENNKAEMVWCDTHWMICDGLTKDLHAKSFEILENVLMGHPVGDIGGYGASKSVSGGFVDSDPT